MFRAPELLTVAHDVSAFESGSTALDIYLKRFALTNNATGSARTYVSSETDSNRVLCYYSLCAGSVEKSATPDRIAKGMPAHPIPVILLARLAVDRRQQGKGLGGALLKDALLRSLQVADSIGIRAILVHAKDSAAAGFYSRFGFVVSPTDPLHLMLLLKDVRNAL